jgi:pentose-5-phosphate-3-epimerase
MSVNPIWGQSFIENTYTKVAKLKALITKKEHPP